MYMKKVKHLSETTMMGALLVVAAICLLPICSGTTLGMVAHSLLVILFLAFTALLWREEAEDERDAYHKMFAGRVAFVTGIALLLAGALYQVYMMHSTDPFLLVVIIAMVLAKIAARAYSRRFL